MKKNTLLAHFLPTVFHSYHMLLLFGQTAAQGNIRSETSSSLCHWHTTQSLSSLSFVCLHLVSFWREMSYRYIPEKCWLNYSWHFHGPLTLYPLLSHRFIVFLSHFSASFSFSLHLYCYCFSWRDSPFIFSWILPSGVTRLHFSFISTNAWKDYVSEGQLHCRNNNLTEVLSSSSNNNS